MAKTKAERRAYALRRHHGHLMRRYGRCLVYLKEIAKEQTGNLKAYTTSPYYKEAIALWREIQALRAENPSILTRYEIEKPENEEEVQ